MDKNHFLLPFFTAVAFGVPIKVSIAPPPGPSLPAVYRKKGKKGKKEK